MTTSVASIGHVPQWTFGDRMRKIRREANMTQAQFAERLGYSDKQVGQWEAGRNLPEDIIEVARRIHSQFGVLPAWTLDIDRGPTDPGKELSRQYRALPHTRVSPFRTRPLVTSVSSVARLATDAVAA